MKIIDSHEGNRTKTGYHTGHAIVLRNGKYYISQESGTRPLTQKEIKKYIKAESNNRRTP